MVYYSKMYLALCPKTNIKMNYNNNNNNNKNMLIIEEMSLSHCVFKWVM